MFNYQRGKLWDTNDTSFKPFISLRKKEIKEKPKTIKKKKKSKKIKEEDIIKGRIA